MGVITSSNIVFIIQSTIKIPSITFVRRISPEKNSTIRKIPAINSDIDKTKIIAVVKLGMLNNLFKALKTGTSSPAVVCIKPEIPAVIRKKAIAICKRLIPKLLLIKTSKIEPYIKRAAERLLKNRK